MIDDVEIDDRENMIVNLIEHDRLTYQTTLTLSRTLFLSPTDDGDEVTLMYAKLEVSGTISHSYLFVLPWMSDEARRYCCCQRQRFCLHTHIYIYIYVCVCLCVCVCVCFSQLNSIQFNSTENNSSRLKRTRFDDIESLTVCWTN